MRVGEQWAPETSAIPVPHEASPAATARRGTRRIPPAIRGLVGRQLSRDRAIALISEGQLDERPVRVVWKVGDAAVVQTVSDLAIPPGEGLVQPVRRIGTYDGARSRIAMFPVLREGRAFMLTLDSSLELAWAQALDMHPDVSALYAQPFMLIWDHDEGSVVHVPDLAATVDGRLCIFEVKPSFRLADRWVRARTMLAQKSLARSEATYLLLGDVSRQRALNLRQLAAHRRVNPFLQADLHVALASKARTVGGVVDAVCAARRRGNGPIRTEGGGSAATCLTQHAHDSDELDADHVTSMRIALEVVMHMLASGHVFTDLDQPLRLSSVLSRDVPNVSAWAES